jgi:hypothetical protein
LKGRAIGFSAFVVTALVGCRGIIGIEDLGLDAGSDAAASKDASSQTNDSATSDGSPLPLTDAGADALPPAPVGLCDAQAGTGMACHGCCRMSYGAQMQVLDKIAATNGCACGPCQGACSSSICGGNYAMPPPSCGACVDPLYDSDGGPCRMAIMTCLNQTECAPAALCEIGCQ